MCAREISENLSLILFLAIIPALIPVKKTTESESKEYDSDKNQDPAKHGASWLWLTILTGFFDIHLVVPVRDDKQKDAEVAHKQPNGYCEHPKRHGSVEESRKRRK